LLPLSENKVEFKIIGSDDATIKLPGRDAPRIGAIRALNRHVERVF